MAVRANQQRKILRTNGREGGKQIEHRAGSLAPSLGDTGTSLMHCDMVAAVDG